MCLYCSGENPTPGETNLPTFLWDRMSVNVLDWLFLPFVDVEILLMWPLFSSGWCWNSVRGRGVQCLSCQLFACVEAACADKHLIYVGLV